MDIVIARYNENTDWIYYIPPYYNVFIYNKGEKREDSYFYSDNRCKIINIPNIGRESDTYLAHITENYDTLAELTIFTQGNPFSHSPDFLRLLSLTDFFKPIQSLTDRWLLSVNIPPANILNTYKQDHIQESAVCAYPIYLTTLNNIWFHDEGAVIIGKNCKKYFNLHNYTNFAEFVFNQTGFKINKYPSICHFCYGAIFTVKKNLILKHSKESYISLRNLNNDSEKVFPWLIERLWLFLFGYEDIILPKKHNIIIPEIPIVIPEIPNVIPEIPIVIPEIPIVIQKPILQNKHLLSKKQFFKIQNEPISELCPIFKDFMINHIIPKGSYNLRIWLSSQSPIPQRLDRLTKFVYYPELNKNDFSDDTVDIIELTFDFNKDTIPFKIWYYFYTILKYYGYIRIKNLFYSKLPEYVNKIFEINNNFIIPKRGMSNNCEIINEICQLNNEKNEHNIYVKPKVNKILSRFAPVRI